MNLFKKTTRRAAGGFALVCLVGAACGTGQLKSHSKADVKSVKWIANYSVREIPGKVFSMYGVERGQELSLSVLKVHDLLSAYFCDLNCIAVVAKILDAPVHIPEDIEADPFGLMQKKCVKIFLDEQSEEKGLQSLVVEHFNKDEVQKFVNLLNRLSEKTERDPRYWGTTQK